MTQKDYNHQDHAETTSQQLLSNLFKSSKVLPINSPSYHDLKNFKQQLDAQAEGPNHKPYEMQKKIANSYKLIFAVLGFLFLMLTGIIYFKTASWICNLFFAHFIVAKTVLSSFCGFLSFTAFFIAFRIKAEREVVNHLYRRAKKRIERIYHRKCISIGFSKFLKFFYHDEKAKVVLHSYYEVMEKLHELRDGTFNLLSTISESDLEKSQKAKLYNQALLELRDNFNSITHKFKF